MRPKSNFSTLGGMSPDSTIGIGVGVAYAPPQPNPTKIVIKANVANAKYLLTFIYVEEPLIGLEILAPILYTLAPLVEQVTGRPWTRAMLYFLYENPNAGMAKWHKMSPT